MRFVSALKNFCLEAKERERCPSPRRLADVVVWEAGETPIWGLEAYGLRLRFRV